MKFDLSFLSLYFEGKKRLKIRLIKKDACFRHCCFYDYPKKNTEIENAHLLGVIFQLNVCIYLLVYNIILISIYIYIYNANNKKNCKMVSTEIFLSMI